MNEMQMENEKPLLVVRYVWWRVLWRLCMPYVPGIFMFYGFGGYFVEHNNPIAYITMYAIMLFAIGMTINLLLTRDFRFYRDRIEKRWLLLGKKVLKYNEINVALTNANMRVFNFRTMAFTKRLECFSSFIRIDRNLISKKTEQKVVQFLADISQREVSEFQENVEIYPFVKGAKTQPVSLKKCWWLKAI
ncbi:MAG: hypothetical protein M0P91_05080 [Sulfuricurvum sp.]|jgi:hypothetical protein|uniref:hypothetical protein n=1 Tax=Sulfuricurvum sp. TaxID=2025608 RepID=UPI0025F35DBB|nr:hypothetical protein [Sulfuricurvum sp.]MCK9372549.1 hypothetical protein [Sulfuricurvum sp.]